MSKKHKALDRARWSGVRKLCVDRDGWRCTVCGRAGRLEVHHVVPLYAGGAVYDLVNLATICRSCHISSHRVACPERVAFRGLLDSMLKRGRTQ